MSYRWNGGVGKNIKKGFCSEQARKCKTPPRIHLLLPESYTEERDEREAKQWGTKW